MGEDPPAARRTGDDQDVVGPFPTEGARHSTAQRPGGLVSEARSSIAVSAVTSVAASLSGVLAARLLGPTARGELALLVLVATVAATIMSLGLDIWASREIARSGDDRPTIFVLRRHFGVVLLAIATTVGAFGVAARGLTGVSFVTVCATAFLTASSLGYVLWLSVPVGRRRLRPYVVALSVAAFFYLVWVASLLALGVRSVLWTLIGAALADVAGLGAGVAVARREEERHRVASRSAPSPLRDILRFSVPACMGALLTLATYRLDLFVVAAIRGTHAVGLYTIASAVTEFLWLFPDAVARVLLPHVAQSPERRDTARLSRVTFWILIVSGCLMAAMGRIVMRTIFGNGFVDAAPAILPLAIAGAFLGVWKLLVADLAARGETKPRAASAFLGVVVMMVSDVVLVSWFGIVGAGIGSILGYASAMSYAARSWTHLTGERFGDLVAFHMADYVQLVALARRAIRGERLTPKAERQG